ncbi:MAG: sn-glycerol-3-phosphate ABC transporter ATP-binding protein UgpC, partial [Merismopedia sp. SIO2A8]|nr:sn-glycerol-3-phosphate ABC transporter ATP-binding protein UgpC [Merismopedia sp. SIO2A8]
MAAVEFEHVFKIYPNGYTAIKDLSLSINDGEFLVFVGPSGCGKSTAMRMLAGLEDISAGKLKIGGAVVNDQTPQQRNIAMVFQNYALYPHMTVRQNLDFPLKMMKLPLPERQQRIQESAQKLGLEALLDRKPKALSGGQRQRVAMGRAIVRDPSVFLMDEPLSNLDAKMRVQIRTEIAQLQRQMGTTMVYVTHDQVEAMTMGDRVAVMRSGELQQIAPPQELYDHPANIFVASFIGSPAMNIFHSQLKSLDDGTVAIDIAGHLFSLEHFLPSAQQKSNQHPPLRDYVGHSVLAGVRPEAFYHAAGGGTSQSFQVTIETVEALGHEMIVYFDAPVAKVDVEENSEKSDVTDANPSDPRSTLIARMPSSKYIRAGATLTLGVDTQKLYLF